MNSIKPRVNQAYTVNDILSWTGGRVANSSSVGDLIVKARVRRPQSLAASKSDEIAFFFSRSYQAELLCAKAGVLITGEEFIPALATSGLALWSNSVIVACKDPYLAMAIVSEKFARELSTVSHISDFEGGIHPTASIHPGAKIGRNVKISQFVVIEDGVEISDNCILYPGCYLGSSCKIGKNCVLFPNVVLYEWTELGDRVRIHANSVIGADGFGYAPIRENVELKRVSGHQKIYHFGKVVIEDDVEVGASSTIDRATFGETRIGKSSKIDNQVQIGHNVSLEEGAVICGNTALAGSSSVGKFAYIAGNSGVANQVHVGAGAVVAAHTLVSKDVPPGATVVGNPQRDSREHFKIQALMNKLLSERKGGK